MLAASASTPNTTQSSHHSTPTAGSWHGVAEAINAAREAIKNDDLAQAERILIELIEFAPVEIRAWKLLAKTQRHLGHIQAGIASARRALQLQNSNIEDLPLVSLTIAKLLWEQHEFDDAREMLIVLLDKEPENPVLLDLQQQWNGEHET